MEKASKRLLPKEPKQIPSKKVTSLKRRLLNNAPYSMLLEDELSQEAKNTRKREASEILFSMPITPFKGNLNPGMLPPGLRSKFARLFN